MSHPADTAPMEEMVLHLAAATDYFRQQHEKAVVQVTQTAQHLNQTAARVASEAGSARQQLLRDLQHEAQSVLADGLAEPVAGCDKRLKNTAWQLENTAQAMQKLHAQMALAQKAMLWKGALVLLSMSFLLLGGTGFLVWKGWQELQKIQYNHDVANAIAAGDLSLCNKRLCVKIPPKAEKYGDGYVIVGGH